MEYKINYKGYEFNITQNEDGTFNIPNEVKEIEQLGTSIKPANEPICVARKPLSEKSVAENVLKWGTGGINIDGCRIETQEELGRNNKTNPFDNNVDNGGIWNRGSENVKPLDTRGMVEGRFPTNIILDETAAELLDEQSGKLSNQSKSKRKGGFKTEYVGGENVNKYETLAYSDKGGASRFFYIAKVSKKERNMGLDHFEEKERHMNLSSVVSDSKSPTKNNHPTVKPVQLMAYLCRLVTPANGIVLDPFMGSGSTGIAACLEGFRFVGMEMDEDYFKIASARIENYEKYREFVDKKKKK